MKPYFSLTSDRTLLTGIGFTALIAAIGFLLATLPLVNQAGPLASAILLAVIYRHFFGYPEFIRSGIQFSAKKLLRLAIILFGLKLNINVIINEGLPLLFKGVLVIIFAIGFMYLLAVLFKADVSLTMLLGIGTGICGASAIAAVSPILKAKEEDTAISAGVISIVGTLFAIAYTIIRPILPINAEEYGIWAGLSLHEIAHVALAGEPAGEEGLGMALLAKLGRVFLLVPVSLILVWFMQKKGKKDNEHTIAFPYFLIGFILMSLFGSYIDGALFTIPASLMSGISTFTSFILTMAMVGLGLSVSLTDVREKALKPMILLVLTSIILSLLSYWIL
ncbi:YeiH family protein [Halobacillus litoralis]|uniref:Putative sulfate exporter family transporter n=1 Tax=Halobacillus litoralis TaxID=45668 RepID=A0A410MCR6_9BACI|nr:putative sulfate exporter family transporter [Halobacillus litoralis]QAS52532.1 putative sulfate exporter family transporter [Halobacillus litoralis]